MSILRRLFGSPGDAAPPDEKSAATPTSASTGPASAFAPAGSREAIVHALVTQIVKQSENGLAYDAVDPDAIMCDRGYIDSLSYVGFLLFIEETYGVRISDYQLTSSLRTVSAVADWVVVESKSTS
jgi:acyl carrier protein